MTDLRPLVYFLAFRAGIRMLLTVVVRLARLHVRGELDYSRAIGLTALFVGVTLVVWWFLTRGQIGERIVQPLILPSPMEVLQSFVPLHVEQGLVRSAITSWMRVTTGFLLATIVALPLGVYMATFSPVAAFFRAWR